MLTKEVGLEFLSLIFRILDKLKGNGITRVICLAFALQNQSWIILNPLIPVQYLRATWWKEIGLVTELIKAFAVSKNHKRESLASKLTIDLQG